MMPISDMLSIDAAVAKALRPRRGETLYDAARRVMATPHGNPAWRVAREILAQKGDPWSRMKRAAKAARRSGLA